MRLVKYRPPLQGPLSAEEKQHWMARVNRVSAAMYFRVVFISDPPLSLVPSVSNERVLRMRLPPATFLVLACLSGVTLASQRTAFAPYSWNIGSGRRKGARGRVRNRELFLPGLPQAPKSRPKHSWGLAQGQSLSPHRNRRPHTCRAPPVLSPRTVKSLIRMRSASRSRRQTANCSSG
jgi:hypothetical protein